MTHCGGWHSLHVDYLIVGSGLTGATIARLLRDHGEEVVVLERRSHMGGNVHDFVHASGIRIHTYGPHYFRTSSERIWSYVQRFARFYSFEATVMTRIDDRLEHWPLTADYINRTLGGKWIPSYCGHIASFEDAALAMMPNAIYERFIKGYTRKQWGVAPRDLDASLASRVEVRFNDDRRLKLSRYQGLPFGGYAAFMQAMLEGIPVYTNVDYMVERSSFVARKLVFFTGAIDEYFGYDLGRLTYRAQDRKHTFLPSTQWFQSVVQVNEPNAMIPYIRTIEWKHMAEPGMASLLKGTVITTETPYFPNHADQYEYPFPDFANRRLYLRYRERLKAAGALIVCGRLGEYRYLDMDQAIGRAMMLTDRVLGGMVTAQLMSEGSS